MIRILIGDLCCWVCEYIKRITFNKSIKIKCMENWTALRDIHVVKVIFVRLEFRVWQADILKLWCTINNILMNVLSHHINGPMVLPPYDYMFFCRPQVTWNIVMEEFHFLLINFFSFEYYSRNKRNGTRVTSGKIGYLTKKLLFYLDFINLLSRYYDVEVERFKYKS